MSQAKGGIDLTPEDDAKPTPDYRPDDALEVADNKATIERRLAEKTEAREGKETAPARKLMPRETGEDVGSSSPIKLSREAREVIRRLRRMKDEQEDWARLVRPLASRTRPAADLRPAPQLEGRRLVHVRGGQVAGDHPVAVSELRVRPFATQQ